MTSSAVCCGGCGHSRISAIGGMTAAATRYNQLRVDVASIARKTASVTAIQQALRIHSILGLNMKPDFHKGFDEADRGRTCGQISVQESGARSSICPALGADKDIHVCCIVDELQRL